MPVVSCVSHSMLVPRCHALCLLPSGGTTCHACIMHLMCLGVLLSAKQPGSLESPYRSSGPCALASAAHTHAGATQGRAAGRRYNWGIQRPDMSLANYFFTQPLEPPLRCALDLPAGDLEVHPLASLLNLPLQVGGGGDCASSLVWTVQRDGLRMREDKVMELFT